MNHSKNNSHYDVVFSIDGTLENLKVLDLLKRKFNFKILLSVFNHDKLKDFQKHNIKRAAENYDSDLILFTPRQSVSMLLRSHNFKLDEDIKSLGREKFAINMAIGYKVNAVGAICHISDDENKILKLVPIEIKDDRGSHLYLSASEIVSRYDLAAYSLTEDSSQKNELFQYEFSITTQESDALNYELKNIFDFEDQAVDSDNLIWIGYDSEYTKVEVSKGSNANPEIYQDLLNESEFGTPLFHGVVEYCARCCMPVTAEGLEFDEMGICQPCRSSEQKMHMQWKLRKAHLENIFKANTSLDYYDCMVPISGGKDSTYQLYMVKEVFGMKPLASTFSNNLLSEVGRYNLANAIRKFDVDHIMLIPRREVIKKLAKKSLQLIGDSCWHCHAGVGAFPLRVAVIYGIKLLIWGESASENDGRATYESPIEFDRDYFTKISARYYAEELVDDDLTINDLIPYILPSYEEITNKGISGLHLGDYIFWDDERQMEFVRDNYGWSEGVVEGTYKGYKSVECVWAGVHDYTKFIKRGFGRGTDHASQDVRAGLLTREEGFELAKKYDVKKPEALKHYLKVSNLSEKDLIKILVDMRTGEAKKLP
jgi:N-acetyl sugar amidotransferase